MHSCIRWIFSLKILSLKVILAFFPICSVFSAYTAISALKLLQNYMAAFHVGKHVHEAICSNLPGDIVKALCRGGGSISWLCRVVGDLVVELLLCQPPATLVYNFICFPCCGKTICGSNFWALKDLVT